jgi:hypothetical protein
LTSAENANFAPGSSEGMSNGLVATSVGKTVACKNR